MVFEGFLMLLEFGFEFGDLSFEVDIESDFGKELFSMGMRVVLDGWVEKMFGIEFVVSVMGVLGVWKWV